MTAQTPAGVLDGLALRCEAATGADRDTDWRIQKALGIGNWPDVEMWPPFCVGSRADKEIPRYTASLDAAMTLVPEGWHTKLALEDRHSHSWRWDLRGGFGFDAGARAATPALALTAAALRARAQAPQ